MSLGVWFASESGGNGIWALSESAGGLAITSITPSDTSIVVAWTGTATHYRINGGTTTALPDGTSPDTLAGLTANTEYDAPGLELSGDGGSTWSDPVAFGTLNPGGGGGGIPYELEVQDATHAHSADSVVLTVNATLVVQDATHAHTADNITLTLGGTTLEVQDALHAHAADNVVLGLGYVALDVQDATHAHTADSPTLTVNYIDLIVQDALHAHTADNVTLTGDVEPPAPPPAPTPGGGGGGYSPGRRRGYEDGEEEASTKRVLKLLRERNEKAAEAEVLEIIMALAAAGVLD